MIGAYYKSRKWALWAWGGGALLIASLWIQVQITVAINTWYGGFYNLLQTAGDYKDKADVGTAILKGDCAGTPTGIRRFENEIKLWA